MLVVWLVFGVIDWFDWRLWVLMFAVVVFGVVCGWLVAVVSVVYGEVWVAVFGCLEVRVGIAVCCGLVLIVLGR